MPTSSQYISTSRAAEHLSLSREHVRRLIQQGELHAEETVNGFMLDMREIERFAATRQVQRDQHEFRLAVNDLAAKLRHVEGATTLGSMVASLRDEAKLRSAFELSDAVSAQMEWMNQRVAAEPALAVLREPVKAVTDQWRRMADDAHHALNRQPRKEDVTTGSKLLVSLAAPNEEMARGFVVTEPREGRLEEKVDELDRKVEKLTELVMQQRADTAAEMPTWQQWAGSDHPEDVLAKLATIREAITGGKHADENSTDVIRAAREVRGRGE